MERQPTPVFLPGESPCTEEPGGVQFMGSQRVRYDWATKHRAAHYFFLCRGLPSYSLSSSRSSASPAVFLYWASLNPRFCFLLKFPTSLLSSSLNWWPHKSFKKENQTKFFHHSVMNLPSYSLLFFTIEETSFLSKAPVLVWILSLLFCSSLLSSLLSFPIRTELCSAVSHPKFCFDPPVFSSCYPSFLLLILLQLFKSVHILSLSLPQVPFTFSHCMTSDTTTPWNCYY